MNERAIKDMICCIRSRKCWNELRGIELGMRIMKYITNWDRFLSLIKSTEEWEYLTHKSGKGIKGVVLIYRRLMRMHH